MFSNSRLQRPLMAFAFAGSLAFLGACSTTQSPVNAVLPPSYADLMVSAEEAHRKGGVVEAMGFYEKAAKADPSKKQPWVRIAQAQFDARNYGAAITASQEVLLRDTSDVTAKSIMAVSGLRVSAYALDQLRMANAVGGSTREEAQSLARIMRDSLGESILPPAVPVALPADKPAAVRSANVPQSQPVRRPAAAASIPAATPEPKRNPFDALKG
jgi:hypothetical protein